MKTYLWEKEKLCVCWTSDRNFIENDYISEILLGSILVNNGTLKDDLKCYCNIDDEKKITELFNKFV